MKSGFRFRVRALSAEGKVIRCDKYGANIQWGNLNNRRENSNALTFLDVSVFVFDSDMDENWSEFIVPLSRTFLSSSAS